MNKYCLIGEKLIHSYSREIHEELGFNYTLKEIEKDNLNKFFKGNEYSGFNVTIPYKKSVIPFLTELTDIAKKAGSVNTVLHENGKFYGHNTDVDGMNYMIARKGVTIKDKHVLVLGSGGTANTAITLCEREKAKSVTVVSRNGLVNYDNCYDKIETEIIINATPVGMYPNVTEKPINLSKFKNLIAVFDCIYNPFKTELLLEAESLGLIYSSGISMLVKQAVLAEDFWLKRDSGNAETERIIKKMAVDKSNVILYGMAGAGKTTVGREVAKILNREFIDTDLFIEKTYGESPSKIITERGISEFRRIETEAVLSVCKLSGKVIALGGGAVLNEENQKAIKRNGVAVYLKRNLNLLEDTNRPLSKQFGVEQLFNERKSVYESLIDVEVENNGALSTAVKEVISGYENSCNKWC